MTMHYNRTGDPFPLLLQKIEHDFRCCMNMQHALNKGVVGLLLFRPVPPSIKQALTLKTHIFTVQLKA